MLNKSRNTLPQFLIIGAMKAGTTTLYDDLNRHPDIFMPPEKEPEDLIYDRVLTDEGLATYKRKFSAEFKLLGEASTAYTKWPDYEAASRARSVLGPDIKIIYIVRNPIERMISHYKHEFGMGREKRTLSQALSQDDKYRNYSRYSWQLEKWKEHFPKERIMTIYFEEYTRGRQCGLDKVCEFLDVDSIEVVPNVVRNASDGKLIAKRGSLAHRFATSSVYQYKIKPYLGNTIRDRLKKLTSDVAELPETILNPDVQERMENFFYDDPLALEALRRSKTHY